MNELLEGFNSVELEERFEMVTLTASDLVVCEMY